MSHFRKIRDEIEFQPKENNINPATLARAVDTANLYYSKTSVPMKLQTQHGSIILMGDANDQVKDQDQLTLKEQSRSKTKRSTGILRHRC